MPNAPLSGMHHHIRQYALDDAIRDMDIFQKFSRVCPSLEAAEPDSDFDQHLGVRVISVLKEVGHLIDHLVWIFFATFEPEIAMKMVFV